MAGEITVSERILFHLGNYVKFEVPFDVTPAREMVTAARSRFEKVGADDMVRRAEKALSEMGQG